MQVGQEGREPGLGGGAHVGIFSHRSRGRSRVSPAVLPLATGEDVWRRRRPSVPPYSTRSVLKNSSLALALVAPARRSPASELLPSRTQLRAAREGPGTSSILYEFVSLNSGEVTVRSHIDSGLNARRIQAAGGRTPHRSDPRALDQTYRYTIIPLVRGTCAATVLSRAGLRVIPSDPVSYHTNPIDFACVYDFYPNLQTGSPYPGTPVCRTWSSRAVQVQNLRDACQL